MLLPGCNGTTQVDPAVGHHPGTWNDFPSRCGTVLAPQARNSSAAEAAAHPSADVDVAGEAVVAACRTRLLGTKNESACLNVNSGSVNACVDGVGAWTT